MKYTDIFIRPVLYRKLNNYEDIIDLKQVMKNMRASISKKDGRVITDYSPPPPPPSLDHIPGSHACSHFLGKGGNLGEIYREIQLEKRGVNVLKNQRLPLPEMGGGGFR